jgi:hypothetical protein
MMFVAAIWSHAASVALERVTVLMHMAQNGTLRFVSWPSGVMKCIFLVTLHDEHTS